jgi:hypothetical protein
MRPLTLDDLLPLQEYAGRRREFFESLERYLDRYRRVRIGPGLTLVFENRQTLWFRVQEILRVARLSAPVQVQQELAIYNRLLPKRNCLQATLLFETSYNAERSPEGTESDTWSDLRGEHLVFHVGDRPISAHWLTCRPEDHAIGAAHWLQFTLGDEERQCLADPRVPARFQAIHASYQHQSSLLSEEVRQSLLEDLALSDRD